MYHCQEKGSWRHTRWKIEVEVEEVLGGYVDLEAPAMMVESRVKANICKEDNYLDL